MFSIIRPPQKSKHFCKHCCILSTCRQTTPQLTCVTRRAAKHTWKPFLHTETTGKVDGWTAVEQIRGQTSQTRTTTDDHHELMMMVLMTKSVSDDSYGMILAFRGPIDWLALPWWWHRGWVARLASTAAAAWIPSVGSLSGGSGRD